MIDSHDNLWIGTNNGLALYNHDKDNFFSFRHNEYDSGSIAGNNIFDIIETTFGCIWIASDIGGISSFDMRRMTFADPKGIEFDNVVTDHHDGSIYSDNIRALCQDRFGNVWVGNIGYGVDVITHLESPIETISYLYPNSDRPQPVRAMCFDANGDLWLGSNSELIKVVNDEVYQTYDISSHQHLRTSDINAIVSTSDGKLLLGMSNDGLLLIDPRTGQGQRKSFLDFYERVTVLYADADDVVLVGTDAGLFAYDADGNISKVTELNEHLSSEWITGITRDHQGKLWIGTYGGGISIFNANGSYLTSLRESDVDIRDGINVLLPDSDGGMWIGTRSGLWHVPDTRQPDETIAYDEVNGSSNLYVYSIVEDQEGHIWISTASTLYRMEHDEFLPFTLPTKSSISNFVDRSALRGPDGSLYFGSLNGAHKLTANWEGRDYDFPPIRITECRIMEDGRDGRDYHLAKLDGQGRVRLRPDETSFQLYFSVSDCALTNLVEYAYMIRGKENKWITLGNQPFVSFRHMVAGDYSIVVRARLINQPWSMAKETPINVTVMPMWYAAWWAKFMYAILAIALVFVIARSYRRRLRMQNDIKLEKQKSQNVQELNDERLRFFTNITHELRTPLTLIIGPLEDLVGEKGLPSTAVRKLKHIQDNANQLLALINQIMEFRKAQTQHRQLAVHKGNIAPLVTEIALHFKELNRNDKVQINLIIDNSLPELYYDSDIVRIVLTNLLSNALKYTPEGSIEVSLAQVEENNRLLVRLGVADTGYGIEKDALPRIFDRYYQVDGKHQASGTGIGLALVKGLADLHQAELTVKSEPGQGTTFYFSLGLTNTYPEAIHKSLIEQDTPAAPVEAAAVGEEETRNEQPLLLIVEDNPDIRRYVSDSFNDKYNIITATNGEEGWNQAITHIPDIIVSDIMMPVMDGNELCKKLKGDLRTSHIPVILLTAKDAIQDKEEGYESGANAYITKPFSAKLLGAAMHNQIEQRRKVANWLASNPMKVQGVNVEAEAEKPELNALDQKFVNSLTEVIKKNIDSDSLDINMLTQEMNMSQSTLYRKIKGVMGISANELIRKMRLHHAIHLMQDEGLNVSEAAYASGFNHIDYFRTCFKAEFGLTPTQYLKK